MLSASMTGSTFLSLWLPGVVCRSLLSTVMQPWLGTRDHMQLLIVADGGCLGLDLLFLMALMPCTGSTLSIIIVGW